MPSPLSKRLRQPGALVPETMRVLTDRAEIQSLIPAVDGEWLLAGMADAQQELRLSHAGHLFIGSINPDLHEHERWQFVKMQGLVGWWVIRGDAQWHHKSPYGSRELVAVDHDYMRELVPYSKTAIDYETARQAQALVRMTEDFEAIALAVHEGRQIGLSTVDRHDLLHHYPVWLARNPEYTDMPRDIVRRMHGLGSFVEVKERLFSPLDKPGIWAGVYR